MDRHLIAQTVSGTGKRKGDTINLPSTKMKFSDVTNNKEYNKVKYAIKEIINSGNLCLIKAIIFAIAYLETILISVICYNIIIIES